MSSEQQQSYSRDRQWVVLALLPNGDVQPYANLNVLLRDYPNLSKSKVSHYLSRLKQPYKDETITIMRRKINR